MIRKRSAKGSLKDLDKVIREQSRNEINPESISNLFSNPMPMQQNLSLASGDSKNMQRNFDRLNKDLMEQMKSDPTFGQGYQPGFLKKKHSITGMEDMIGFSRFDSSK